MGSIKPGCAAQAAILQVFGVCSLHVYSQVVLHANLAFPPMLAAAAAAAAAVVVVAAAAAAAVVVAGGANSEEAVSCVLLGPQHLLHLPSPSQHLPGKTQMAPNSKW